MIIHQIFLDIGLKPLCERQDWLKSIETNKKLNPNSEHILWDDEKVNNLLKEYPEYNEMIATFPHKFYLIDFIRYLILWKYGGVYIDLDVCCKQSIEDFSTICGVTDGKINNNVIKITKIQSYELLQYAMSEYKRITDNKLYSKWAGRHFINSVSAGMFKRWCKNNKIVSDIKFEDYFWDEECKSWVHNQVCKKDYNPNKIKYGSVNYKSSLT